MPRILYLGAAAPGSTSYHRAQALQRLGHAVDIADPFSAINHSLRSRLWNTVHYRSGYLLLQKKVQSWLSAHLKKATAPYDLVWVNSGELLGRRCIQQLSQQLRCPVVLYNNDDPTGPRDGNRFRTLRKALPYYDLVTVVRRSTASECTGAGSKKVLRVFMSYDEVAHQPFTNTSDIPAKFRSDVAFIGTWMPGENRDAFLLQLIKQGVPLSIWGDAWQKSNYFDALQPYWKGAAIYGRDYVAAVQGTKICLGMLSKGNRDMHTQRSLEIPYIGSLFCAERTPEHLEMYKEGVEAVFWSSAEECAAACKQLLADEAKRDSISRAGARRVKELKIGNEDVCREILNNLLT